MKRKEKKRKFDIYRVCNRQLLLTIVIASISRNLKTSKFIKIKKIRIKKKKKRVVFVLMNASGGQQQSLSLSLSLCARALFVIAY